MGNGISGSLRGLVALTGALLMLVVSMQPAHADDSVLAKIIAVDIPAQQLTSALIKLSTQSGTQILMPSDIVNTLTTQGIHGQMSLGQALTELLRGTSLTFHSAGANTIGIDAQGAMPKSQSMAAPGSPIMTPPIASMPAASSAAQDAPDNRSQNVESASTKSAASSSGTNAKDAIPEILVKGSRIMNVDVKRTEDDAQPYYIFDSQQIEQSGATNAEDFLKNMLTMNTTFQTNSQQSGYGLNESNINLRGLGTNETLILIDGRRSANAAIFAIPTQPDINGIPISAIERIEVLPSSASAIYGGAAVGGVVNIILKKNFNGGEIGYTHDDTFDAHSRRETVNAVYGFSLGDGKTRVMVSGHYSNGDPLTLQDRLDLYQRGISAILANSPSYLYNASNPFSGATPNIACQDANGNPTNCILKNGTSLNSPITYIPAGTAPGSNLSGGLLANAGKYNLSLSRGFGSYGLQNQIGTVPTTKSLMTTIRHEFSENLEVFLDLSTVSNAGRTLEGTFGGSSTVPASAPNNPFQETVQINFPNNGATAGTSDSVTHSGTIGLLTHFSHDWSSEIDYTWSENSIEAYYHLGDGIALASAIAAGTVNPFVDTIAYPPNLSPYLGTAANPANSTLNDLGLRASGPVGSLPWGTPILTIGLEHRKEGYDTVPFTYEYPLTPSNDYNGISFGQSQSTNSLYAEANIPVVTDKNTVPGIQSLNLQLAGRSERYTVDTQTATYYDPPNNIYNAPQGVRQTIEYTSNNPTIGLKYQPIRDVTLRTSYAKAFLPPTASQLLPNLTPQCGSTPCNTVTDPLNGRTYNVNDTCCGSPALHPQTSRDWDLGIIWEPKEGILNGLRVDAEYYRIVQPNYIVSPTAQQAAEIPALVTRDPVTGLITSVNVSYLNATEYKTNGWDFTIDYRRPTPVGTLGLHAVTTFVAHDLRQLTIGSPFLNYAGYPGSGGEAKEKGNVTVSWQRSSLSLAWTALYTGSYYQAGSPGDPTEIQYPGALNNLVAAQGSDSIRSQIYHNIVATYVIDKAPGERSSAIANGILSNIRIQLGVRNVFNTLPPLDTYYPPLFYSSYGDPRLRSYWLNIKKDF